MRCLFYLRWLFAMLLGLSSQSLAHASHLLGGDIAYRPVAATTAGVPRYHVTVRLFVNTLPGAFDQKAITLLATQGSCSAPTANSFRIDNIPRSAIAPGSWLTCSGSTSAATYNINLFEVDVDLLPGQWTLAVVGENRAASILNISSSISATLYFSTTLDNSLTTQNSSPIFTSNTLPILTGITLPNYSFSAYDAEGDSLSYAFVLAQNVPGGLGSVPGAAVCSTPLAGSMSPHFTLNSWTGALSPQAGSTTTPQGYFVMAARVSEYRQLNRQWKLLGTATRDITYVVVAGGNRPPTFTTASVDGGPAQVPEAFVFVRPGQSVQVTLTATDPDAGQVLRFSSDAVGVVPGLGFTTLSATQARLSWQAPTSLGRYSVPVTVVDNGCPYNASEDRTITFVVAGSRVLGVRAGAAGLAAAYPTPFREQVQFAAPAGQAVLVLDALGRAVAHLQAGPDGLVRWAPAPGLPPGLYLARAADAGTPLARLLRTE